MRMREPLGCHEGSSKSQAEATLRAQCSLVPSAFISTMSSRVTPLLVRGDTIASFVLSQDQAGACAPGKCVKIAARWEPWGSILYTVETYDDPNAIRCEVVRLARPSA